MAGARLEITLHNTSGETWLDCYAEVCLQLARAPEFADTTRERTFGRIGGQWKSFAETVPASPNPQHNTYLATPGNPFLEESVRGWWTDSFSVRLDHPLIAVRNKTDTATIGISFEPCSGHCNNLSSDMACIHSDPYLGRIASGEQATVRGRIFYHKGPIEALLQGHNQG